jgi:glyoxylase-like metal-dependent hydrolase (beta-lactamase superfamily II)
MNPLEAQLDYPFGERVPAPAERQAIVPGLDWVRMPLPFALDHINLWVLADAREGRDGWSVVDCGAATDATRSAWRDLMSELPGPPQRVFATHCHPDHVGMSAWLCQDSETGFWMSAGEYAFARAMSAGLPGVDGSSAVPHFQRHGLTDPELARRLGERRDYYPSLVPAVPHSYHRLQDGQQVRIGAHHWRVIAGFGHSPEHVALYCEALNVLISGDMVLPRISTNVSVFAIEPEGNPLQLYLDSLRRFEALPADTLVLPSHGRPFRGLHTRVQQLREHHARRLADVVAACAEPQSAVNIVPVLFPRSLDTHQLSFALGEALAHLHKLWHDGILRRVTGADGVLRFQLA